MNIISALSFLTVAALAEQTIAKFENVQNDLISKNLGLKIPVNSEWKTIQSTDNRIVLQNPETKTSLAIAIRPSRSDESIQKLFDVTTEMNKEHGVILKNTKRSNRKVGKLNAESFTYSNDISAGVLRSKQTAFRIKNNLLIFTCANIEGSFVNAEKECELVLDKVTFTP